ncbi:YqaH family protein [Bacillus velezensis]|uniref:YqaH family protein n=1 Tax=Bacillus velezensis TaxID=492670 RepID=UPI001C58A39A|nr:YqaH family protein [Bacillus velezensis]MDN4139831.1 YqaH family protein [Bacillus velezensis]MDV2629356.1 YqaH family protein [Bacillus velezensis]
MKINQFLKADADLAKRKIESAEELSILLSEALRDGDYEEAISLAGSIKVIAEDINRLANKGHLHQTVLNMAARGIHLSVVSRCSR